MPLKRAVTKRTITSWSLSTRSGMAIQLARETLVSEKATLSASLVAPSTCSRTVRLSGLQRAQASTSPVSMAVTMAEASMFMAVMSSMVRPTLERAWVRMVSLEVPAA